MKKLISKILITGTPYSGKTILASILKGKTTSDMEKVDWADIIICPIDSIEDLIQKYKDIEFNIIDMYCDEETQKKRAKENYFYDKENNNIGFSTNKNYIRMDTSGDISISDFIATIKIMEDLLC